MPIGLKYMATSIAKIGEVQLSDEIEEGGLKFWEKNFIITTRYKILTSLLIGPFCQRGGKGDIIHSLWLYIRRESDTDMCSNCQKVSCLFKQFLIFLNFNQIILDKGRVKKSGKFHFRWGGGWSAGVIFHFWFFNFRYRNFFMYRGGPPPLGAPQAPPPLAPKHILSWQNHVKAKIACVVAENYFLFFNSSLQVCYFHG